MTPEPLRLVEPFVDAHPRLLTWAAQRSSLLRLPPRRWLVRSGRQLQGRLYLLRGQVRLLLPDGKHLEVSGQTQRARWPVYPGPAAILTLTQVQLLRLDATHEELEAAVRFGDSGASEILQLPEMQPPEPCWQHRFLSSALMQRLSPAAWQRLLRAMVAANFRAGEAVLVEGRPGNLCYVLGTGRAEVRRNGHVLALLAPGDLFGEEALITGSGRNASIVMTEDGSVMTLSVEDFQRLLLAEVVRAIDEPGARVPLQLVDIAQMSHAGPAGMVRGKGAACLQLQSLREATSSLQKDAAYAVSGASAPQRALAVFLLARQGIVAAPLGR
jgi:CRP-like cAMP-binding protein